MRDKLWTAIFGENSMLRQAYAQFFLALGLVFLFFLPTRILIQLTFLLSVWAIIISAQAFISAATGAKAMKRMLEHIEDILERLERMETMEQEIVDNIEEAVDEQNGKIEAHTEKHH